MNVTDANGRKGKREVLTMPQWAGSCWYPLRFMDPRNPDRAAAPEIEKKWSPVDLYIGGAEHATLHLLYSRFWYMALHDLGHIETEEPFAKHYRLWSYVTEELPKLIAENFPADMGRQHLSTIC